MVGKGFLKLRNLHLLRKQKSPLVPRNLPLVTFGELPIVFSTKVNLLDFLYWMPQRCCLLYLIKQNCFLKTFLRTLILMTQLLMISLPVFSSRTNLKLHIISITSNIVKKVLMNLDLLNASGPDCILEVVPKNCEPELYCILGEVFHKCLKESCFPDCWKVSSVARPCI